MNCNLMGKNEHFTELMKYLQGKSIAMYPAAKSYWESHANELAHIIHCKDCKWLWTKNMLCIHPKHCDGMVAVCECDKDGFCSYGERRENATD